MRTIAFWVLLALVPTLLFSVGAAAEAPPAKLCPVPQKHKPSSSSHRQCCCNVPAPQPAAFAPSQAPLIQAVSVSNPVSKHEETRVPPDDDDSGWDLADHIIDLVKAILELLAVIFAAGAVVGVAVSSHHHTTINTPSDAKWWRRARTWITAPPSPSPLGGDNRYKVIAASLKRLLERMLEDVESDDSAPGAPARDYDLKVPFDEKMKDFSDWLIHAPASVKPDMYQLYDALHAVQFTLSHPPRNPRDSGMETGAAPAKPDLKRLLEEASKRLNDSSRAS